ncbi:Flp family type IVb pilin [Benzoatithermus flavus]|uniref:Flp family type IVb pilin n=1 Tax=Benzoatithermus flavus TaxID=3108223 RepID=A0ABU8XY66_9PROT
MQTLRRFLKDESGATAIEYGLIAALIAVVVIGAIKALGTNLETTFDKIADCLGSSASCSS